MLAFANKYTRLRGDRIITETSNFSHTIHNHKNIIEAAVGFATCWRLASIHESSGDFWANFPTILSLPETLNLSKPLRFLDDIRQ